MVAPNVKTQEIDQSYRVSSAAGSAVAIVIPAKKGPTYAQLMTSDTEYLKNYTANESIEVGDTLAHFSALAVLDKSDSLWVRRAISLDALYGGIILKAVSGAPEQLSVGLSDPKAYLFKEVEGEETPQITEISFTSSIDGSLTGKYFVLPGRKNYVWYKIAGVKQVATITTSDAHALDVSDSVDNLAKFFILPGNKFYAYFVINGAGSDPKEFYDELTDKTAIPVIINDAEASPIVVTKALADKVAELVTEFEVTYSGATLNIKCLKEGLEEGNAGSTDFVYVTSTAGTEGSEDPKPSFPLDMVGIPVEINQDEIVSEVARKTYVQLNAYSEDFECEYEDYTATMKITAKTPGKLTEYMEGTSEFEFTTLQYGGASGGVPAVLIYQCNQGSWGNDIVIKIFSYAKHPDIVGEKNAFMIKVFKETNLNEELESFICSLNEAHLDGNGKSLYITKVLEGSNYIRARVNPACEVNQLLADEEKGVALSGGSDGSPVTDADMIRALKESFTNKDEIKVTLLIDGGWATPAYHTEMIKICKSRMDCFAILSTPLEAEDSANFKNEIVNYRKNQLNANTSYAALVTPHVKVFDYFNNRDVYTAPDGQFAGALVDAERNYEIWYPVLGYRRGVLDVTDVNRTFSTGDMNLLYDNGVNPLRKVAGKGIVIWGQKTLQAAASALDRINVRMMLIKVEPAIEEFLENYVGELNTPQTRAEIKSIVDDFLRGIAARNGIAEFKTICDKSNNTPSVIAANEMLLWTYVKPTMSAEFITNKMIITPQSVSLQ